MDTLSNKEVEIIKLLIDFERDLRLLEDIEDLNLDEGMEQLNIFMALLYDTAKKIALIK